MYVKEGPFEVTDNSKGAWEEPVRHFCESRYDPSQPEYIASATSLLITVFAVTMVLFRGNHHNNALVKLGGAIVAWLGLGSFAFHYRLSEGWGWVDTFPMTLGISLGLYLCWIILYFEYRRWKRGHSPDLIVKERKGRQRTIRFAARTQSPIMSVLAFLTVSVLLWGLVLNAIYGNVFFDTIFTMLGVLLLVSTIVTRVLVSIRIEKWRRIKRSLEGEVDRSIYSGTNVGGARYALTRRRNGEEVEEEEGVELYVIDVDGGRGAEEEGKFEGRRRQHLRAEEEEEEVAAAAEAGAPSGGEGGGTDYPPIAMIPESSMSTRHPLLAGYQGAGEEEESKRDPFTSSSSATSNAPATTISSTPATHVTTVNSMLIREEMRRRLLNQSCCSTTTRTIPQSIGVSTVPTRPLSFSLPLMKFQNASTLGGGEGGEGEGNSSSAVVPPPSPSAGNTTITTTVLNKPAAPGPSSQQQQPEKVDRTIYSSNGSVEAAAIIPSGEEQMQESRHLQDREQEGERQVVVLDDDVVEEKAWLSGLWEKRHNYVMVLNGQSQTMSIYNLALFSIALACLVWEISETYCPTHPWLRYLPLHPLWHIFLGYGCCLLLQVAAIMTGPDLCGRSALFDNTASHRPLFNTMFPLVIYGPLLPLADTNKDVGKKEGLPLVDDEELAHHHLLGGGGEEGIRSTVASCGSSTRSSLMKEVDGRSVCSSGRYRRRASPSLLSRQLSDQSMSSWGRGQDEEEEEEVELIVNVRYNYPRKEMGKAGKARKKRRLERELGNDDIHASALNNKAAADDDNDDDIEEAEGVAVEGVATKKKYEEGDDLAQAILVLKTLSQRLDLYGSKAMKPIRTALYPLIQIQQKRRAFFDSSGLVRGKGVSSSSSIAAPTDEEAYAILTPSPLAQVQQTAKAFAHSLPAIDSSTTNEKGGTFFQALDEDGDDDEDAGNDGRRRRIIIRTGAAAGVGGGGGKDLFYSPLNKPFRRALHPLVLEQYNREGKPVPTVKELSLSGRISMAFRRRDWREALLLLKEMELSRDEHPKLGALQRWVRDCDLAASTPAGLPPTSRAVVKEGEAEGTTPSPAAVAGELAGEGGAEEGGGGWRTIEQSSSYPDGLNTSLLLLDGVLRVAAVKAKKGEKEEASISPSSSSAAATALDRTSSSLPTKGIVHRHPFFSVPTTEREEEDVKITTTILMEQQQGQEEEKKEIRSTTKTSSNSSNDKHRKRSRDEIMQHVRIVSHVKGPLRRPPSPYDLYIHATAPGTIVFDRAEAGGGGEGEEGGSEVELAPSSSAAATTATPTSYLPPLAPKKPRRYDIPGVSGAFLMTDILTSGECRQIIEIAEAVGYVADAVDGIDNMNWLADDSLLGPIFERCRPLLPPTISGRALGGINARWRLFRYFSGAIYRPHIDGAWPGSGLDEKGAYTDDAFDGKMYSKLTFLVYLNGGFEGGATTFFLPKADEPGVIEARGVQPRQGAVLCFPHGDAEGSLVHEGSAVVEGGFKYIIRSDVLYAAR